MGNNSSKPKKSKSQPDGFQSYPSFSRSDTQGSTKSSRSIRSRLSTISNASDAASFKTAIDSTGSSPNIKAAGSSVASGPALGPLPGPSILASGGIATPGSVIGPGIVNSPTSVPNNILGQTLSSEGYPFPVLPGGASDSRATAKEGGGCTGDIAGSVTANSNNTSLSQTSENASPFSSKLLAVPVTNNNTGTTVDGSNDATTSKHSPTESRMADRIIPTPIPTPGATPTSAGTPTAAGPLAGVSIPPRANQPSTSGTVTPGILGSPSGITVNIEEIIQRLLDAGYSGKTTKNVCLRNGEIALICQTAREIFLSQPSLLDLSPPVKVVGDVHGQYGDLIRMFEMCGFPPSSNYLFLGDYVDRGKQSLETILLLLCYKIKYPENFFLLRGNHECANVTRVYGFYDECKRRCNIKTWKIFIDTFNTLPIAAVVAQKIFCVHGGLSPSLNNMAEVRQIQRPTDVPDFGLLNDLLWSDPADAPNEWEDNERGVSYCFNKSAINKFLTKFGFDLVCRAHMVVEDGYEFFNDRTLVTVFSAPNYCGEFDNWGAVMSVSEELLCSFELLKPLDSIALKQEMRRGKQERRMLNSPLTVPQSY